MEQYKVRFIKAAGDDLRETANYIATYFSAPISASNWTKDIKKEINKKLSSMPQKYRLVSNTTLASMGFRSINVKKRIIFFTVDEKKKIVNVQRIIYGRREWLPILLKSAEDPEFEK